jgi:hypothetical protein
MVGILVYGDNHFIVRGRFPIPGAAVAIVHYWWVMQKGAT